MSTIWLRHTELQTIHIRLWITGHLTDKSNCDLELTLRTRRQSDMNQFVQWFAEQWLTVLLVAGVIIAGIMVYAKRNELFLKE